MSAGFPGNRIVVVGLRVVGTAVARAARDRGIDVVAVDDRPTESTRVSAAGLGVELVEAPDHARLARLIAGSDAVVVSPGVPEHHPVHAIAADAGVPIASEYDLAAAWDSRPCIAVTGTDGKTTVTTLVAAMLSAAGRRVEVAGNADVPLVEAIADPSPEAFVVEASSFGLGVSRRFAPRVATWLNLAPDHLDAHVDLAHYEDAKARIWANLGPDDVAIANADDPIVVRRSRSLQGRVDTFGLEGTADWTVAEGRMVAPGGLVITEVRALARTFPHDIANFLAAAASAAAAGASLDAIASVAESFRGLPHRVVLVGEAEGVRYYDDSKATTPHATLAAVAGFPSVVLIAGGHNKGLDLGALAMRPEHVRSVVAIGAASGEVAEAFSGVRPVQIATSMDDAVRAARLAAQPGDAVLLSPGCASFDWYNSYAERGDDFARAVREQLGGDA